MNKTQGKQTDIEWTDLAIVPKEYLTTETTENVSFLFS